MGWDGTLPAYMGAHACKFPFCTVDSEVWNLEYLRGVYVNLLITCFSQVKLTRAICRPWAGVAVRAAASPGARAGAPRAWCALPLRWPTGVVRAPTALAYYDAMPYRRCAARQMADTTGTCQAATPVGGNVRIFLSG